MAISYKTERGVMSPSARREWIEILSAQVHHRRRPVSLREEGVD